MLCERSKTLHYTYIFCIVLMTSVLYAGLHDKEEFLRFLSHICIVCE